MPCCPTNKVKSLELPVLNDNIKFTSQIGYCPYCLSLDMYKGCPHGCKYCFAQTDHLVLPGIGVGLKDTVSMFSFDKTIRYIQGDTKLKHNHLAEYIHRKQPFHIGGMSDPFPFGIENRVHHTLAFIKAVGEYPCIWSTKNPPAAPEYLTEIERGNHIFQFSCIGLPEYDSRVELIEPGLPRVGVRFENLTELKKASKKIILRLQPFIPFIWNYDNLNKFFDKVSGVVDGVSIEFLKKPVPEPWKDFSKVMGFDINKFFVDSPCIDMGQDKVFDTRYRYEMLKLLKKMIHERGMEFYAAENYFRSMSDGPACCGVSEKDDEVFQSKLTYCLNTMLFKAKKEGSFCWDDIEKAMPEELKKGKWVSGFRADLAKLTIKQVLKRRYQTNKSNSFSPGKMFCDLKAKRVNGKLHYFYVEKDFNKGFDLYLEQYDKDYGNSILKDAKVI